MLHSASSDLLLLVGCKISTHVLYSFMMCILLLSDDREAFARHDDGEKEEEEEAKNQMKQSLFRQLRTIFDANNSVARQFPNQKIAKRIS